MPPCPAFSFESVLKKISASHFLGLTATPFRKDGLQAIIHMQCGPILYSMLETKAQTELAKNVIIRETTFRFSSDTHQQPTIHEIWENWYEIEIVSNLLLWML